MKYNKAEFILALLFVVLFTPMLYVLLSNIKIDELEYSEFKQAVASGAVRELSISSSEISGQIQSRWLATIKPNGDVKSEWQPFHVLRVDDPDVIKLLDAHHIRYRAIAESSFWTNLLAWLLPFLLMFLVWQWLLNRSHMGQNLLSISKSKAKVYVDKDIKISFKDLAGIDDAVEELSEVVRFLTEPSYYTRLGGRLPKGLLLVGAPGTGKTLLARAVAGEAKVPFFSLSGSEFVELFVGVGAARVRDLFEQAQKQAPCIIFIDELDALGRARGVAQLSSNEEREQTLNQLLTEMDGFDPNSGVVLMAATNRPEILDPALLRAGRFDRHIVVDSPDVKGREAILRLHTRRVVLANDVDLAVLAARTPGFVGADLANIVNEAALLAARTEQTAVAMVQFDEAIDRVLGGLQKKTRLMTAAEKHRVANHESGHALVAMLLPQANPIHKISIIPRGVTALGFTTMLPPEDRHLFSKSELLVAIQVLLGGRAAESIVFGDLSTGAADDLQKATLLARRIVAELGMSDELGPVVYDFTPSAFLPGSESSSYSEETAVAIDHAVSELMGDMYQQTFDLLLENKTLLLRLAAELEKHETLEGKEVRALLGLDTQ